MQFIKDFLRAQTFFIIPSAGDTNYYYVTMNPILHGLVSAVESAGDETLMTQLIAFADAMIGASAPIKAVNPGQPPYPGWYDTSGFQADVHTIDTVAAIARVTALIMTNPTWKAKYGDKAQKYIQFANDAVIRRYFNDTWGGKIPWRSDTIWDEAASVFGVLTTALYQSTGMALYRDLAIQVGNLFRAKLKPNGPGWIWDDGTIRVAGNEAGVPDTRTAGNAVRMMVIMHEAGLVFSLADVNRMASTLTDIVWNGSLDNPQFANYINGSNLPFRGNLQPVNGVVSGLAPGSNGLVTLGWGMLSRYSQKAFDALDKLLDLIFLVRPTSGSGFTNFTVGRVINLSGDLLRYKLDEPGPPAVTSVLNAASRQAVPVAPGTLLAIEGSNFFGKEVGVTLGPAFILPLSATENEILLLVPPVVGYSGSADLVVTVVTADGYPSRRSAPQTVTLAPVSPAIFSNGIVNGDGSANNPSNPALVGGVIRISLTGLAPPPGWTVFVKIHDRDSLTRDSASPVESLPWVQRVTVSTPSDLPEIDTSLTVCGFNASTEERVCSPPAAISLTTHQRAQPLPSLPRRRGVRP